MSTDHPGAVPAARLAGFAAIGLAELNGQAALLKRLERKYVLDQAGLEGLFDVLRFSHSVLEIDGLRSHGYQSRYYDTPDLLCFRAHNQGRANRFKLRIRRYEDSGLAFCELKEKTRVAATAKSRVPLSDPSELGDDFGGLLDRVRQIAGAAADRRFLPTLDVGYRRITLFDARDQTRVTIDTGLSFGKAIDLATQSYLKAQTQLLRGQVRSELKKNGGAIEDLEAGLQHISSDPEAMKTLARLYDQEGRHADALAILEKLCVIEPNQVGHWTNRGFELTMLGRYDEALKMIELALAMDKDEPVALSNRAYVRMKMGSDAEAWNHVERSLRFYPSNPFALCTKAMLRLRKGDRAKACEDLTLAKALGGVREVEQLIQENCDTSGQQRRR